MRRSTPGRRTGDQASGIWRSARGLVAGATALAARCTGGSGVESLGELRDGAEPRLDRFDRGAPAFAVALERLAHGRQMLRAGAAASADDARTCIERDAGIV